MIQQITKGIKISITSNFEEKRYQSTKVFYIFSYSISIENQGSDTVQWRNRHWKIVDSLNKTEVVDGEGVIGRKPILKPKQTYTYTSNCYLSSPIGSMNGFYEMINFNSSKIFNVHIPTFQLMVPATFN